MKILIVSRGNPELHPVLRNYRRFFEKKAYIVHVIGLNIGNFLRFRREIKDFNGHVLCADPIACLPLVMWGKKITFLSMEMFEYQVPNNSFRNKLRNCVFKMAHIFVLKKAVVTVFCNIERLQFYLNLMPQLQDKSCFIENFHSSEDVVFSPLPTNISMLLNKRQKQYESTFIYAGALQEGRFIPELIAAFESVPDKLLIIAGNDHNNLIPEKLPENIVFIGHLKKESLNTLLQFCDYAFLFYSNDLLNTRFCAPVKLYENAALNLAMISNENVALKNRSHLIFRMWDDMKQALPDFIASLPSKPPRQMYSCPNWDEEMEVKYKFILGREKARENSPHIWHSS